MSRPDEKPRSAPTSRRCDRRHFLKATGTGAAAAVLGGNLVMPSGAAAADSGSAPETTVKRLYDSLSPEQRKEMCFGWDYVD